MGHCLEPARHRTDYAYDPSGRLTTVRQYTGQTTYITTSYSYDGWGQRTGATNASAELFSTITTPMEM